MRTSRSLHLLPLPLLLQLASSMLCLFFFREEIATAQDTDPAEVSALNTIFQRWGAHSSSSWNTAGGDPCTGAALNSIYFDHSQNDPNITCDCITTTCHITQLKLIALDVTGPIPQELQVFKRLTNLNIAQNYLTGPLPAFFGNFTEMEYLSVGINALSGSIPKELGNLKKLKSLNIGTNNFSGTFPPELGGMISLQELYMDSSGLSGQLPYELSNLKSLTILWISDNDFTGKVPEFFGSFTNLTKLRMQGNSFQGPIPDSFSNLTQMIDLRIGDIVNGSSTLHFITNMQFLEILILRNCKISDALPSNFSQYNNSLQYIDLSFNNITGSIPTSLFNLSGLRFLFLGNNSLTGSLPTGNSWYLTSVALLAGLKCLQNDIPCYRDSPVYSSFAVNCGGSRTIRASDDIMYEMDNAYLGIASYNVTDSIKWAVSSVGTNADSPYSVGYVPSSSWEFNRTLDTELFETSRLSASSLRYYGLGLENGNYAIKLLFAETEFIDGPMRKSVGRRIFDIYIQGDLKEKDFDIRKQAGGTSFTAVVKEYTAPVTKNFLEIHFFWAGKGTRSVPHEGYYGPSISAISVSKEPPSSRLVMGLAVGAVVVVLAILCLILGYFHRKKKLKEESERELHTLFMNVKPDSFSYTEMRTATENFSSSNKLGEGGYGPVFKGKLSNGKIIAVKQLSVTSHQGKHQFLTEIATICAVQHRNLVKLLGYCVEGEKCILVYEFLENKSLDQALFGERKLHLDWPKRFRICLGIARGLAYLHEEASIRIVHRDVKASNILLDADLNPKISDFGLAKRYDEKKTHMSTKIAGTIGYLAPEYAMTGHLTKKADVYAFGVLCLEILAGRANSDQSLETDKIYLLEWVWCLHENKRDLELIDGSLSSFDEEEVRRVIGVALLCTQASPAQRPLMSRVVAMLAGDIEVTEVTVKPSYLDYTSTSHVTLTSQGMATMSTPSDADSLMNSFIQEGR